MSDNLNALAKTLATSFVATETVDALLWKYDNTVIPALRPGLIALVTVRLLHQDEEAQALVNGAKLLEAVKQK